jgi:hypothetical protein
VEAEGADEAGGGRSWSPSAGEPAGARKSPVALAGAHGTVHLNGGPPVPRAVRARRAVLSFCEPTAGVVGAGGRRAW